jgi:NADH:ubiquinone oxidoreductase subunit K
MNDRSDQLIGIIGAVRKRRNLLIVLRGLAITISTTAAMLVIAALAAYRFRFNTPALVSLRIFAASSVIAAVYFALVRPLRRRASEAQLARLVEERHPGIEDRFVSAIEFSGEEARVAFSPVIVDRLVDDADRHASDVSVDEIVPRKRFWQFGGAAAAGVALFIAALVFGPKEITMGFVQILMPGSPVAATNALKLEVKPGTARVPKGSDQKIFAKLLNFNAEQATVFTRKAGASDDQWVGQMMEPAKNNNEFQFFIFNIQDDTEYWVESNSVKTEVFKLTVADLPYVKRIDQTQSFPSYTGIAPKTIEDAPNVSVLAGTTVKLVARLTGKAKAARIVLREGGKIEMEKVGETDFAASMTVNKENTYHIEVTSVEGDIYNGSNEYDIALLEDRPPTVSSKARA